MKRLQLFSLVLILGASSFVNAQTATHNSNDGRQLGQSRERSQPATGSMYFNEKFLPARIGAEGKLMTVRYNAYNDEFETNAQGEPSSIAKNAENFVVMTATNKKYEFVEYTDQKGEKNTGYLIVHPSNGSTKFYERELVILEKERFPTSSYDTYKAPNYRKEKPVYFISLGEKGIVALPTRTKDFSKLFPGKEKEVQALIKTNKIELDEPENFSKLSELIQPLL